MAKLTIDASLKFAKELTTTAIEHDLIPSDSDATKAAENVYLFFQTLQEKLSGEKQ